MVRPQLRFHPALTVLQCRQLDRVRGLDKGVVEEVSPRLPTLEQRRPARSQIRLCGFCRLGPVSHGIGPEIRSRHPNPSPSNGSLEPAPSRPRPASRPTSSTSVRGQNKVTHPPGRAGRPWPAEESPSDRSRAIQTIERRTPQVPALQTWGRRGRSSPDSAEPCIATKDS